jgi:transglutaminase-like putative cysteine protease
MLKKAEMRNIVNRYFGLAVIICFGITIFCLSFKVFAEEGQLRSEEKGNIHEQKEREKRTVTLTYSFEIENLPPNASRIRAWVPIPLMNSHQHLEDFRVLGDWSYNIVTEPEYGNRFIHLDLSQGAIKRSEKIPVNITFTVTRWVYRVGDQPGDEKKETPATLHRFLSPDRLVPIGGKIAEEARRVAGSASSPLEKAKLLYDNVVQSVRYDNTGIGWGRGDAIYACEVRKGNCTDFHSLFIGEARSLGIPARFKIGLALPKGSFEGVIHGYHCWAEFYVEGKGWIPLEASEASKNPEKKDAFFGRLDENRVEFSLGRDIRLPGASAEALNYILYPHIEVDGKTFEKVETNFSFREKEKIDR